MVAGDAGIFSAEKGFSVIFNVWDDETSIRRTGETISYHTPYRTPRKNVQIHDCDMHEGDVVLQGMTAKKRYEPNTR